MEAFQPLDFVIVGGMALLALIGLFRGLSGELGSLAGLAAGIAAGLVLYVPAQACAESFGFAARGLGTPAAIVIDFVFGLVVFGLVRWAVARFVSCCLGRVVNALLGLVSGLAKGCAAVALLAGVGVMERGTYATGFLAGHSTVIRAVATWADGHAGSAQPSEVSP